MADQFAARLREITRAAAVTTGSPDPHVVAHAVLDELSQSMREEALRLCLPDWVRRVMTEAARAKPPGQGKPKQHRRAWYTRLLQSTLYTAEGDKHVADCTADDLRFAAAERYAKAAEIEAHARKWERTARYMDEHDRATVSELTETELRDLWEAELTTVT